MMRSLQNPLGGRKAPCNGRLRIVVLGRRPASADTVPILDLWTKFAIAPGWNHVVDADGPRFRGGNVVGDYRTRYK